MTNPYGITLDRAWTEWAAEYGVSPTVAAALFLISVHRPAHEVAAKLTACEFKQVIDIVRRWPNNFASGTLAALKTQKHAAQRELTTSTSTDVASGRPGAGIKASAEDTRRTHECRFESFRIHAACPINRNARAGAEFRRQMVRLFQRETDHTPGCLVDVRALRPVAPSLAFCRPEHTNMTLEITLQRASKRYKGQSLLPKEATRRRPCHVGLPGSLWHFLR